MVALDDLDEHSGTVQQRLGEELEEVSSPHRYQSERSGP